MEKQAALYRRIYDALKNEIEMGIYTNGRQLPTEMELSRQYFVSRITAKKAVALLEQDGLIYRVAGKGTFLRDAPDLKRAFEPRRHAKIIALVMGGYSISFGLELLSGVLAKAEALGLHVIYKLTGNDQHVEAQMIRTLMDDGVSGIIIQPAQGELRSDALREAVAAGLPIVMVDRVVDDVPAPYVGTDNRMLSRIAVEKLLAAGHRDIALMTLTNETVSTMRERMEGFREAFANRGIPANESLWKTDISETLVQSGLTPAYSRVYDVHVEKIAEHLKANPEITAIFGAEYLVSQAAWEAVQRIGKRVPNDYSIICFDRGFAFTQSHSMCYIRQRQAEMGMTAVDLLEEQRRGAPARARTRLLDGEWVEGGSIAGPRTV